jgi:hypothetical protein
MFSIILIRIPFFHCFSIAPEQQLIVHVIAMQFRVVIPSNIREDEIIRIRCPNGIEGEVRVPKGLKGGDSFVFEMPEVDDFQDTSSSHPRTMERNRTTTTNKSSLLLKSSLSSSLVKAATAAAAAVGEGGKSTTMISSSSSSSSSTHIKSFLDREIVNWQDFFMALGIGMFIGMSIIFGFLLGILAVTEPKVNKSSLQSSSTIQREMRFPNHFHHQKQQPPKTNTIPHHYDL